MTSRFYIETSDEKGPVQWDCETRAKAIDEARAMIKDGWSYVVVVDRKKMLPALLLGDYVQHGWNK